MWLWLVRLLPFAFPYHCKTCGERYTPTAPPVTSPELAGMLYRCERCDETGGCHVIF